MGWIQQIFQIDSRVTDEQLRRQGLLVIIVSTALTLLSVTLGLRAIFEGKINITTGITLFGVLIYITCIVMARSGRVRLAAYLITWVPLLGIMVVLWLGPSPIATVFLSIPILLSSLVLSSWGIFPVALLGLLAALLGINQDGWGESLQYFAAIFFVIMSGALAYLGAWSVERALGAVQEASHKLEQANHTLNAVNSDLEDRVARRTSDLAQAMEHLRSREAELHATLSDLRSSQDAIRELSAPILPVAPSVLVAPIIGAIDSARVSVLLSSLLTAVERNGARYLILDVTGTPVIDTQVAQALIGAAQALRLLGTQVLLTGIRPEVAQTLVSLGVDLSSITTRGTLQDGIADVVRRVPLA